MKKTILNLIFMILIILFSTLVSAEIKAVNDIYPVNDISHQISGSDKGYLENSIYDTSTDVVIVITKNFSKVDVSNPNNFTFCEDPGCVDDSATPTPWLYYRRNITHTGVDYMEFYLIQSGIESNRAKLIFEMNSNSAPIIAQDNHTIDVDESIENFNLLANDTDPDGDTLFASIVKDVRFGTATLSEDGYFNYTPNPGKTGVDYYTYKITDLAKSASVENIIIIGTNIAPVANNNYYQTPKDTELFKVATEGILINDYDENDDDLLIEIIDDVKNGSLILYNNGSFIYTPNTSFEGVDYFTYKLSDRDLESNIATVFITVGDDTQAPEFTVVPEDAEITEGESLSVKFEAEDNLGKIFWEVDNLNFTIDDASGILTNATVLSPGTYEFNVTAKDEAGNSISVVYKVTVNAQPLVQTPIGGGGTTRTTTAQPVFIVQQDTPPLIDYRERYGTTTQEDDDEQAELIDLPDTSLLDDVLVEEEIEATPQGNLLTGAFIGAIGNPNFWFILIAMLVLIVLLVFVISKLRKEDK